jgi:hypothetical protein
MTTRTRRARTRKASEDDEEGESEETRKPTGISEAYKQSGTTEAHMNIYSVPA